MSSFNWSPLGGGSGGGGAVDSVNSLTGALTIAAGAGISVSAVGTTITVTNTAGGLSIGSFGATPNVAGLSLAAGVLTMQPADGSNPGGVSTGTQTFAGNKTFSGTIAASNLSGTNTGDVTIGTASGLSLAGQALSLGLASAGVTGALSGADWSTFNSKQAAGNYITALTGDVTASGPGSVAATVALVGGVSAANVATAANLVNTAQSGRKFLASPDDGSSGAPAFRAIVAADVPTLNQNTTGTASNITASSNATLTTLSALSLPGSQVTGNISGNAANVTGTVAIANGGTGQTAKAAAFDALSPMTTGGDLIYGGASGTGTRLANGVVNQVLTSSGGTAAPVWNDLASQIQAPVNYIANSIASVDTTGYATYADAAGTQPVDGTGGSANITFTRSTSSPIANAAMFQLAKDAANRQGQGVSYQFSIASGDQGKMLQIGAMYSVASGTYVTGDVAVYIVDVTNGTVIQPAGYQVENVGVVSQITCTFQTTINSTSYRLCFHVASTSALAYTLNLTRVTLGPQVVPLGAPVTDWVAYTPTSSWVAGVGTITGKWRRVGDTMEISGRVPVTGTPTTATLTISLPGGYVIDFTKLGGATTVEALGIGYAYDDNVNTRYVLNVKATSSTTLSFGPNAAIQVTQASPFTWAVNDNLEFMAQVPIVGWSSSTVVSSSADTRVVAFRAYRNTNQTGVNPNGSAVKIAFDTISDDSVGGFDTSTNRYNVKVPGRYIFNAQVFIDSTNVLTATRYEARLYVNGSLVEVVNTEVTASATIQMQRGGTFSERPLNANDYVEVYFYGSGNNSSSTLTAVGGSSLTYFSGSMLQGPSQIAASEVISLVASRSSSNQAIATSAATVLVWNSAAKDSHGMLNTSTGVITVPAPGDYRTQVNTYFTGCANESFTISIRKNSTIVASYFATASVPDFCFPISYTVPNCVAGDTIDVVMDSAADTSYSLVAGVLSTIAVNRLGGVM